MFDVIRDEAFRRRRYNEYKSIAHRLHLDVPLLLILVCLTGLGLVILYSASFQDTGIMTRQLAHLLAAFILMFIFAQIPVRYYKIITPWFFLSGLLLLITVLVVGKIGKGAQRWLDLGVFRFQPSEMMKLSLPMMIALYLSNHPIPPRFSHLLFSCVLILIPGLLIMRQPDLGTAILVFIAGGSVLLFAGISGRIIASVLVVLLGSGPVLWSFMHDYQKQRVMTFLNPEADPLGSGYHIIQSKIAIGSGGIFGKGWLNGTQSQLSFLPEHATDFIFAVISEEFGLIGSLLLLGLILLVTARAFYIASQTRDWYSRLLAAGLGLSFFLSAFINMGMVTGLLPVVGLPLPLVSYGGTAMLVLLASFGILMAIHSESRLTSVHY